MNQNQIIILLSTAALAIYLISYIRKRPAALLSFLGRGAAGLSDYHSKHKLPPSPFLHYSLLSHPHYTINIISCLLVFYIFSKFLHFQRLLRE